MPTDRRARNRRYYERHRMALLVVRQFERLEAYRALPAEARTVRQQRLVLERTCLPWERVCTQCWAVKPKRAFRVDHRSRAGRQSQCWTCEKAARQAARTQRHRRAS